MIAFSMVAFIAMLGLAIDMGYVRYMQRQIQTAADNAALAGAMQIPYANNANRFTHPTTVTQAADAAASEDNFTDGVNGVTVNVCEPPNTAGAYGACPATPYAGGGSTPVCSVCAEVTVTDTQVPTFFSQNFGAPKYLTISATAVAEGSLNCIYGLDTADTSESTMTLEIAFVNSTCGVVDNDNLGGFFGGICAPSLQLKGSNNLVFGGVGCGFGFRRATPVKIANAVADPFAYLASVEPSYTSGSAQSPYGGAPADTCGRISPVQTLPPAGWPAGTTMTMRPTTSWTDPLNSNTDGFGQNGQAAGVLCGGLQIQNATGGTFFQVRFLPGQTWKIVGNINSGMSVNTTAGQYTALGLSVQNRYGFGGGGGIEVDLGSGTYYILGGISDGGFNYGGGFFSFGSHVNFNWDQGGPALYVLQGGGLTMTGNGFFGGGFGSVNQGNGVTFYNTGTGGTYNPTPGTGCAACYGAVTSYFDFNAGFCGYDPFGNDHCGLIAPTTGPYAGILFWQDPANTQNAAFNANFNFGGDLYHQGAYYFPGSNANAGPTVNFDFDFGTAAQYTYLVARDISWVFNFTFNRDTHTLPNGSPLAEGTAVLVQ
jgi:Flp pilus assembly protein TadG